jgi:hypothetical protein
MVAVYGCGGAWLTSDVMLRRERERLLASDAAIGFGGSRFISTKVHC